MRITRGSSGLDGEQGRGGRELDIGLVQHQQRPFRQRVDERLHLRRVAPSAHRVVGIGEEDERRLQPAHGVQQGFQVDPVVAVGHGFQHAAEAGDMVVEGRVGAERGDHRRARLHDHAHDIAQHLVDARAQQHFVDGNAVKRGDGAAELMALRIVVPGDVPGGLAHGFGRSWGNAEGALVRADPDPERLPQATLQRLRADERNRRGQALDQAGETGGSSHGHLLAAGRVRQRPRPVDRLAISGRAGEGSSISF